MLRFGPAGVPITCKGRSTLEGVRCVSELGLEAFEVEFVRGVRMGIPQAREIGELAKKLDISLSAHCPYWINTCAKEEKKRKIAIRNLLETARVAHAMGARVIVFHPGYYMGRTSSECMRISKATIKETLERMKKERIEDVFLGAETTGGPKEFGSLDEVLELAHSFSRVVPVLDFGHMHAREGGVIKGKSDYAKIFSKVEKKLGKSALKNFHSHFSELEYSKEKGEIRHIVLGKNEPPFKPLAELIIENGYSGTIICESPILEQDALKMKRIYRSLLR